MATALGVFRRLGAPEWMRGWNSCLVRTACLGLCLATVALPSVLQGQMSEYEVEALFLERISRFVDWPVGSDVSTPSKSFVIGVLGESPVTQSNPFGEALEKTFAEGYIKGKRVRVRYISKLKEIESCNAVYVSSSARDQLAKVLEVTHQKPILTLGNTPGFGEAGVHINFYLSENKVRFELNEPSLRESKMKVDSLLLRNARIVRTKERIP